MLCDHRSGNFKLTFYPEYDMVFSMAVRFVALADSLKYGSTAKGGKIFNFQNRQV